MQHDRKLLEMALKGYQFEIGKMQEKCREIEEQLNGGQQAGPALVEAEPKKKRRKMSVATRAKMAAAQRARWAHIKKPASKARRAA